MIQPATVRFLKKLAKNNNKPWFDLHREVYETARKNYENFIQSVIDSLGRYDPSVAPLIAKHCLFRINRDIRFSKNKTPYKKIFAASINRGGKKSIYAGYYFHLEPGNSFTGGGIWMPMPSETQKIRQEIDYCWPEFRKIITAKKFRTVYGDLDNDPEIALVNVPRGYTRDNPAAPYLKLKSWIAMKEISDADLSSPDLLKQTVNAFTAIQPLIAFLNRAVDE
ncbi:MAG TPA: DUF2461 domain-containing protein [Agriterribacter sp.]|nr:DUF2461 domain-containing protein [Agriterribacter sp.]HRQ50618.1 DUF2461 domain-containing protein [Agriterribacter sp.]